MSRARERIGTWPPEVAPHQRALSPSLSLLHTRLHSRHGLQSSTHRDRTATLAGDPRRVAGPQGLAGSSREQGRSDSRLSSHRDRVKLTANDRSQFDSLALAPTSPLSLAGVSAASSHVPPLKNGTLSSPPTTPFVKAAEIGAPSASASAVPVSPSLVARAEAAPKGYSSRVVLTTYPGQVGIHPIPLRWGAPTPEERGPVVASRQPNSLKVRNAIGAYSGSYSIYRAIAAAAGQIDPSHRPGELSKQLSLSIGHTGLRESGARLPFTHPRLFPSHSGFALTSKFPYTQTTPTPNLPSRYLTTRRGTTAPRL